MQTYREQVAAVDYVSNLRPRTFPKGLDVEVYPLRTLRRLEERITDSYYREWFPVYLWSHESEFLTANVASAEDLSRLRWTVDYPEDLEFVRAVYRRLGVGPFGMAEILVLLRAQPQLAAWMNDPDVTRCSSWVIGPSRLSS